MHSTLPHTFGKISYTTAKHTLGPQHGTCVSQGTADSCHISIVAIPTYTGSTLTAESPLKNASLVHDIQQSCGNE